MPVSLQTQVQTEIHTDMLFAQENGHSSPPSSRLPETLTQEEVAPVSTTAPASGDTTICPSADCPGAHSELHFLGDVGIGPLILRANRVNPGSGLRDKIMRTPDMSLVQIRLGSVLLWAFADCCDKVEPLESAWQDLETWKKLGHVSSRYGRNEFPISRDGSLEVSISAPQGSSPSSYIVSLQPHGAHHEMDPLVLDFGSDGPTAKQWYDALRLMTDPWDDILRRTEGNVVKDLFDLDLVAVTAAATTFLDASAQDCSAQECREQFETALQSLDAAQQNVDGVSAWVETIVKALEVSQPVVDGVLTKVPLVGAGFQVISLCLSAASKVAAAYADQMYVAEIRHEIDYIAGHTLLEMMAADAMSSTLERGMFLRQLTDVMAGVDNANVMLDRYLLWGALKSAADGVDLQSELGVLRELRSTVFALGTSRAVIECRDRAARTAVAAERTEAAMESILKAVENHMAISSATVESTPTLNVAGSDVAVEMEAGAISFPPRPPDALDERHIGNEDVFVPFFYEPRNPTGVVLALNSTDTSEGVLKAAVLRENDDCVGAVGSTGMGGVGKTCALKAIACDEDVTRRFTGGVYYLMLGKDATPEQVVFKLAEIVESSGGSNLAAQITSSVTVDDAETEVSSLLIEAAAETKQVFKAATLVASWFSGCCCLFVFDDIWETADSRTGYLVDLFQLVDSEEGRHPRSGSCLLYSTRNHEIGDLAESSSVEFSPRDPRGPEAERMLCAHAKQSKEALCGVDGTGRAAVEYVLDQCAGLPLALAVAGRAIVESMTRTVGQTAAVALLEFEADLEVTANERLLADEITSTQSKYTNLSSVFEASLKAASGQSFANATDGSLSVEEILWALCVMPKKAFAPVSMLQQLWDVKTEREAANVVRLLSSRSLVVEEVRDGVRGITLHDLVLDFCVKRAEEHGRAASWHRCQLDGYVESLLETGTGNRMRDMEEVITYCHASMRVLTRETAPHDWALSQRRLGSAMMKRMARKRSLNVGDAITCYRSALAVWTKDSAAKEWALTQKNLGDALRDRIAVEKGRRDEECIECYRAALSVWTRDEDPMDWADTQDDLGDVLAERVSGDKTRNNEEAMRCHRAAFHVFLRFADSGDTCAMTRLGLLYDNGHGVTTNSAKAAELYSRAADAGDAWAMRSLGSCYERGDGVEKDAAKAAELYSRAADAGDARAMNNLGVFYENGEGVEKDAVKAVDLYMRAADAGDARAMCNLGVCCENGEGVERDAAKAVDLYMRAADAGDAGAMRNLGFCYERGEGVDKDAAKAVELYKRAVDVGDARAMKFLGCCYDRGKGVEKDVIKAGELYARAADASDAAINNFGYSFERGDRVVRDAAKADGLFTREAGTGHTGAIYSLGLRFLTSEGVE
jgi:TPR repeat protein